MINHSYFYRIFYDKLFNIKSFLIILYTQIYETLLYN